MDKTIDFSSDSQLSIAPQLHEKGPQEVVAHSYWKFDDLISLIFTLIILFSFGEFTDTQLIVIIFTYIFFYLLKSTVDTLFPY